MGREMNIFKLPWNWGENRERIVFINVSPVPFCSDSFPKAGVGRRQKMDFRELESQNLKTWKLEGQNRQTTHSSFFLYKLEHKRELFLYKETNKIEIGNHFE